MLFIKPLHENICSITRNFIVTTIHNISFIDLYKEPGNFDILLLRQVDYVYCIQNKSKIFAVIFCKKKKTQKKHKYLLLNE